VVAEPGSRQVIHTAEAAAGSGADVVHGHAQARWTGRTLQVEIEGWVNPDLTAREADALGRQVADAVAGQLPEAGSLTWTTMAAPSSHRRRPGVGFVTGFMSPGQ
jgi:hypothetical protein